MGIRGLIPQNFAELAEAVPIGIGLRSGIVALRFVFIISNKNCIVAMAFKVPTNVLLHSLHDSD